MISDCIITPAAEYYKYLRQMSNKKKDHDVQFQGAVVKEQGITFAIVVVKQYLLHNHTEAKRLISSFQQRVFGAISVVLMAQDASGVPEYYGRRDIAQFLSQLPLQAIPWKQYTTTG